MLYVPTYVLRTPYSGIALSSSHFGEDLGAKWLEINVGGTVLRTPVPVLLFLAVDILILVRMSMSMLSFALLHRRHVLLDLS